jgi:hypothetical protein
VLTSFESPKIYIFDKKKRSVAAQKSKNRIIYRITAAHTHSHCKHSFVPKLRWWYCSNNNLYFNRYDDAAAGKRKFLISIFWGGNDHHDNFRHFSVFNVLCLQVKKIQNFKRF